MLAWRNANGKLEMQGLIIWTSLFAFIFSFHLGQEEPKVGDRKSSAVIPAGESCLVGNYTLGEELVGVTIRLSLMIR